MNKNEVLSYVLKTQQEAKWLKDYYDIFTGIGIMFLAQEQNPTRINPLSIKALAEIGIDTSQKTIFQGIRRI